MRTPYSTSSTRSTSPSWRISCAPFSPCSASPGESRSLLLLIGLGEGFRSGQRRGLAAVRQRRHHDVRRHHPRPAQSAHRHDALQADPLRRSRHPRAGHARAQRYRSRSTAATSNEVSELSNSERSPVLGVETNFPQIRNLPARRRPLLQRSGHRSSSRQVVVLGQKNNKLLFPGRPIAR